MTTGHAEVHRTAGTRRVFEAGSELWQFPVSRVGSPRAPVTRAVGRFIGTQGLHTDLFVV